MYTTRLYGRQGRPNPIIPAAAVCEASPGVPGGIGAVSSALVTRECRMTYPVVCLAEVRDCAVTNPGPFACSSL